MRPFLYQRPANAFEAIELAALDAQGVPPTMAPGQFLAGGTTLLDLMKLDVMRPERLGDIGNTAPDVVKIERRGDGLFLGALVTMAQAAENSEIRRNYPVIAQSLDLA